MTVPNQNIAIRNNNTKPKLKIKNFIMVETHGDYKDIFSRSINVNADTQAINGLSNLLNLESNIRDITPMEVSNHITGAASLTSIPSFQSQIPNGWQTKRIRYMLAISVYDGVTEDISYIQGFTEYADSSLSGYVDPNMLFYINSIISVVKVFDHRTGSWFVRPKRAFNVIDGTVNGYEYQEIDHPDTLKLARPVDVMSKIHVIHTVGSDYRVIDTTGTLANTSVSSKINSDPSNYLANTLNGFLEAKSSMDIASDEACLARNTLSSSFIREGKLIDDIFIRELYNITNIINPTNFTLRLLSEIDPEVNIKGKYINRSPVYNNHTEGILAHYTDTANTYDTSVETIKSAYVVHSLNSALLDNMLTKLSVAFTNEAGPMPLITITSINSFIEDIDLFNLEMKIKQHIRSVLMPVLTDNNYTLVKVLFESDLLGDTNISISINNGPDIIYRYPAYADSLFSPMIATNATMQSLTSDVANLMDATYLTN